MGSKAGKDSVADYAYETLKKRIIDFEIAPNCPLVVATLAAELNISRIPLREALRMLERDHLVERNHNKGFTVRGITEQDMKDIFEIRAVLEGWAAGKAAEIASKQNIDIMENYLDEADDLFRQKRFDEANSKSDKIHDIIAFIVNNRWYSITIENLSNFTQSYKRLASSHSGQLESAFNDHRKIFESIRCGDVFGAQTEMSNHIYRTQQAIITVLNNRVYSTR
jgi:DNA-binding GntR family transcriptional regulator